MYGFWQISRILAVGMGQAQQLNTVSGVVGDCLE